MEALISLEHQRFEILLKGYQLDVCVNGTKTAREIFYQRKLICLR